ncbi:MAG: DUF1800 domain-containing protein, partial [Gammaproteobacteria bacterium]
MKRFYRQLALSLPLVLGLLEPALSATGDMTPLPAAAWNAGFAAHLLERAGFGATPGEIKSFAAMGPRGAVR